MDRLVSNNLSKTINEMKLLFVFGTRPECIKLSPLILEARARKIEYRVCFTGQHSDMVRPILELFSIQPDYDLNIMKSNQTLNYITEKTISGLNQILENFSPTHLIVQGDTTTAAAAAIVGFYDKLQVVHVEAGLRTYDLNSPWPEEFNRRIVALTATWHFTPTEQARQNLIKEGIAGTAIRTVGNSGIDALRIVSAQMASDATEQKYFNILVTLHRRESFGSELIAVILSLKNILERHQNVRIRWPMHQNPQVKKAFDSVFTETHSQLQIFPPLGYKEFIQEMKSADLILTDSGGIQEEAPFLGKPTLICRQNTERPEAVQCGSARLVGTNTHNIVTEIESLIDKSDKYQLMAQKRTPFGDGYSSQKILEILSQT